MERFKSSDVEAWRRDGGTVIQDFFTPDEVAAVVADFELVFGRASGAEEAMDRKKDGEVGRFNPAQFATLNSPPFDCSPALNLIGTHPALVAFAKAALKTDSVYLYQCQAWAKFTGDADYDQPFHCDFVNHTLTAPSEDPARNCITILCYFTDVTDAHGPAHYVPRRESSQVAGPESPFLTDPKAFRALQDQLRARSRSSAAPAGSVFPYSIDVWHRGTNLTAPGGHRYAVMACFKAAGDDSIDFTAWPHSHTKPWARIFAHGSPEQLECFGVKPPGHPFWTEVTLARAQARYPGWDMTAYREALAS